MKKRIAYRYVGGDEMEWTWKRKTVTLIPGQFISRECYLDLGKELTIMQVVNIGEGDPE